MEPFIGSEVVAGGGLTRGQLRWGYTALHPDVYLRRGATQDLDVRTRAAWLWTRRRGIVAGRAAAAFYCRPTNPDIPVELIGRVRRSESGVIVRDERIAEDEIVVVDCGLLFSDLDQFGVEFVIPDFTYLIERKDKVKAFLVTHGHEDHVGEGDLLLRLHVLVEVLPDVLGVDHRNNRIQTHPSLHLVVDAMQSVGVMPVDVQALGVTMLAAGTSSPYMLYAAKALNSKNAEPGSSK